MRMTKGRLLTAATAVVALVAVALVAGASGKVWPHKDAFKAEASSPGIVLTAGTSTVKCGMTATGTLPESASVVKSSSITFTSCTDSVAKGTASVTASGTWEFELFSNVPFPKSIQMIIPSGGLVITVNDSEVGQCKGTSSSKFVGPKDIFSNGAYPPVTESMFNSESRFNDTGIPITWANNGGTCKATGTTQIVSAEGINLIWTDTTNPTTKTVVAV